MIETERLLLRKFTLDDAEAFYKLNSDPEVVRYVDEAPLTSVDQAISVLHDAPPCRTTDCMVSDAWRASKRAVAA